MAYPILTASSAWYKSTQARNTITQINIVNNYSVTGSENETWSADVDNSGSIKCYRAGSVLTIVGNGSGKIAMNANSSYLFSDSTRKAFFTALTSISGLELLDTSSVTNMSGMFYGATKLTVLDVDSWDTSKVTNMTGMFGTPITGGDSMALTTVKVGNWNTSAVTTMQAMFQNCANLTTIDVSNWNVSKVTNFQGMFQGKDYVGDMKLPMLDVSKWDTSSATNMTSMFYGCGQLETLAVDNWDVSKVTTFNHTFTDCFKLKNFNLSKWKTSALTIATAMFNDCHSLTTLDVSNFDMSKVTDAEQMFERCTNLETIIGLENWDTSKMNKLHQMFLECTNLKNFNVSNFVVNNPYAVSQMFEGCENVTELDLSGFKTIDTSYLASMFKGMYRLEKITVGAEFKFDGSDSVDSTAVLPTPDATYIEGANGNWYTINTTNYTPENIPNLKANTYYASLSLVRDMDLKIKNGTLLDIATSVKQKAGITGTISPLDIPDKINEMDAGINTFGTTATSNDIQKGKTAFVNNVKIIGTLPKIINVEEVEY